MLQPYIPSIPLIHKLVLFGQPPCQFTFQDHGYRDPCIALLIAQILTIQSRVNVWAFPVTVHGLGNQHTHAHIICIAFTVLVRTITDNIFE